MTFVFPPLLPPLPPPLASVAPKPPPSEKALGKRPMNAAQIEAYNRSKQDKPSHPSHHPSHHPSPPSEPERILFDFEVEDVVSEI